ncbi:AAA-domain-containing protein [Daedalea quercina L-15889]|uniref:AAA-domain-containing protein n=1 Tax=Daedalea quercina L-15889 TaxID=1314783 RepID=A0A165P3B7_9APHY|nr:AAA-domain-containing protein [Daedalea quercina L-15889]
MPPVTPDPSDPPNDDEPGDEPEKPRRRRAVASSKDTDPLHPLPRGLDILWTPENDPSASASIQHALPPPEIFEDILHDLHITLHPQTQHRATYTSPSSSPIEPSLALYSPIEGGDVYVDETVREMARRTGAEVVVLDSVQLAAGPCGEFGKAASVLQLPNNPLHFPSPPSQAARSPQRPPREWEEDDWEDGSPYMSMMPSRMTLQVLTPVASRAGRPFFTPAPRDNGMSKLKAFFDDLININAESNPAADGSSASTSPSRRPRIIYIRDFATLAPSSATWYPALLAAVRQRRQGPISRPSSPVLNPTTIVFGITPPIAGTSSSSSASGPSNLMSLLMSQRSTSSAATSGDRKPKVEFGEDAVSEKARERRTTNRMRRWARSGAQAQDIPQLASPEDMQEASNKAGKPDVVVLGGHEGLANLPSMIGPALSAVMARGAGVRPTPSPATPEASTQFWRTSLVLPNVRTASLERETRMARRREINELTMRMGVAAVGGELEPLEPPAEPVAHDSGESENVEKRLWEDWGKHIVPWSVVRRIADRTVGRVVAERIEQGLSVPTLEPTPIPWSAVYDAWVRHQAAEGLWKTLLTPAPGRSTRELRDDEEGEEKAADEDADVDEVVERLKRDPELDPHEARLLGSIVDTSSLTTTFSQVHLPEHTIDSVRTIVSLPLLHPAAFQHGLLKEHNMTGCLLFGPPGTGKTLVVRALAKEAGCRMLAIKPSDVMDMYVGEGEKLVRAVFSLARKLSPCVVFIDELDALFGARISRDTGGGIAHRGVITEFMQEMDGLKSSKDNVIVIGATNRPFDLDDAVLRRLPRRLLVDLPGEKEREEILKILVRDETLAEDVDLKTLAKRTESFSGSDLKHLCVAAVLDAVKERVEVPWRASHTTGAPGAEPPSSTTNTAESAAQVASESTLPPAAVTGSAPLVVDEAEDGSEHTSGTDKADEPSAETAALYNRTIHLRNFEKALKEITPSASESLGSLTELRKWNEEFGEGRKQRRQIVWGKGKFGFTIEPVDDSSAGRVVTNTTDTKPADAPTHDASTSGSGMIRPDNSQVD